MAQRKKQESKDLLSRLADAGEEAIQRLSDVPGGRKVLDALNGMRERVDELQHRVKALGELEQRVKTLEEKVDKLAKPATRKRTTTRRTTTASRKSPRTPRQKS
jgi:DNA repair ATPase RecN